MDGGSPCRHAAQPEPDTAFSAEERESGGLGGFMAKKIMDRVPYSYADGWDILTIEKGW